IRRQLALRMTAECARLSRLRGSRKHGATIRSALRERGAGLREWCDQVDSQAIIGFAAMSFALIVIPGPSVLFVIGRSLALGKRGGLLSVLGNELGGIPLVLLVAAGVGNLVAYSAPAFLAVKLLGAGYLVYLGVQAIRQRKMGLTLGATEVDRHVSSWRTLLQGIV